MKVKIWAKPGEQQCHLYIGEGYQQHRFNYPYRRLRVTADKEMMIGKGYEVKDIVFRITKSITGYNTLFLKYTHGFHFRKIQRITGCHLLLGEEITIKKLRELSWGTEDQRGRYIVDPFEDAYRNRLRPPSQPIVYRDNLYRSPPSFEEGDSS